MSYAKDKVSIDEYIQEWLSIWLVNHHILEVKDQKCDIFLC